MAATITQGTYKPLQMESLNVFHGIPYARWTKRFDLPQALEPSQEIFSATNFGCMPPQRPSRLESVMGPFPSYTGAQDEFKCGVLSIYAPSNPAPEGSRPVIVFIHGGGFVSGGSQTPLYHGSRLALEGDVVVVCINYRFGVFGFLYDSSRSLTGPELPAGIADIVAAFEWVKGNIAAFGGDPHNITAFGQSAGAYNIQVLLDVRPDLFHRGILQSSPAEWVTTPTIAKQAKEIVVKSLPSGQTLDEASVQDLLTGEAQAMKLTGLVSPFCPTANDPPGGRHNPTTGKDFLIGWTKDDGLCFARMADPEASVEQLDTTLTDTLFKDPSIRLAQQLKLAGHSVTSFELTWAPDGFELGATHCTDLPLVLGDQEAWKDSPMVKSSAWSEWESRGHRYRQALAEFAKHGTVPATHGGFEVIPVKATGPAI